MFSNNKISAIFAALWLHVTFAAAFLFLSSQAASAYILPPPDCTYEKYGECLRTGKLSYLVLYGYISPSDEEAFYRLDHDLPRDSQFPTIYLDTGGGNMSSAIEIGRILRKNKATVKSGNPVLQLEYTKCLSACVMIAAGATQRFLVNIGLHSPSIKHENSPRAQAEGEWFKLKREYYDEMGINPLLARIADSVPFDQMLNLTYDPAAIGKYQYIVQFGFYQGPILEENDETQAPIEFKPREAPSQIQEIAAFNGSSDALSGVIHKFMFGNGKIEPNEKEALEWLKFGLEHRDKRSAHNIALYYWTRNKTKSIEYLKQAAELGFAGSQNNLGWAYYKSDGVKRSVPDAVFWITKAAEQGETFAYGSLCQMHADGNVFKRDNVQAFKWCNLALWDMSDGKTRDNTVRAIDIIKTRITTQERRTARLLVQDWKPLSKTEINVGKWQYGATRDTHSWLY